MGTTILTLKLAIGLTAPALAQTPTGLEQSIPSRQDILPPDPQSFPELEIPERLPPPEELIRPQEIEPSLPENDFEALTPSAQLCISSFRVLGSTVFSADQLNQVIQKTLKEAIGPPQDLPNCRWQLTFAQLLLTRSAITDFYVQQGYVTSGAFIPANQRLQNGIVYIQVIEGQLADISVDGTQRLQADYIASRLSIAAAEPLNINQLLEALQMLRLDPLIATISAELQAGVAIGTSRLLVEVAEADSFNMQIGLDNNRAASLGSLQRRLSLYQGNLTGAGDTLDVAYSNTDGSNEVNLSYTVPVSPRNSTVGLTARLAENRVVTGAFRPLGISAKINEYSLIVKHPLVQTPEHQFDLGLTLSRQFSQTRLGIANIGPFPLSPGADSQGRTVVSALRFSQNWTQRQANQAIALRSQFSLGLGGFLGGTVNDAADVPDNEFFTWQGQGQWVRRLGDDSLLLARGNVQLATDRLLSSEQLGLGGQATVRGYRENELLTDKGLLASVEARFPLLRVPEVEGLLQVTPFIDAGYGWNAGGDNPTTPTLVGIGTGFLWQQQDLSARFDWGIPLTEAAADANTSTLQSSGLYFSINYSFF